MKRPIHILVISQYFYPEQFRINDMCLEWVRRGYKVTVVTGIPNYPMGKFFPGYSLSKRRKETWKGIDIIRIPLIPRGHSSIGMVLNYFSFPVSGWWWNLFSKIEADIVFSFEASPMTQVKVGCKYSKKHKVPHFLYAQDLWPENVETVTGIHNKMVIGPIDRMVDKIYKRADRIFVTSPSFAEAIVNRKNTVDRDKVIYWPQYAEEFYRPLENRETVPGIPADEDLKIAFTGNIGAAQGLSVLPKTARLLGNEKVKFVVVGNGRYRDKLEQEIETLNVRDKFILIPRQPAEKIPEILGACDAGFISFRKDPLWDKTIPAKLQSYMACGKAIVASASGETKRIIEEAGCGVCCDTGDEKQLADTIRKIDKGQVKAWGRNARLYSKNNFDKGALMDKMDVYFAEVVKR